MDPGDRNAPVYKKVPFWGADGYSVRMAVRNFFRAQPAYAALTGVGVRPAPVGASSTEGVKSTTWLPPQQFFRSSVGKIADPTIKNVPTTAQFPSTDAPGAPAWLIEWSRHQIANR